MRSITSIFLFFFIQVIALAQPCLPEGITFTTQAQIDSFQINHPNCTEIEGDVDVYGMDITNLNGLSVLTSIGGDLIIKHNDSLTSLTGLNNLNSIGRDLIIDGNDLLTSLSGLEGLSTIDNSLYIGNYFTLGNALLSSLSALENLTRVGNYLVIGNNPSLISLTGLEGLEEIQDDVEIMLNTTLTELTGLNNIDTIWGKLNIESPALINLEGLESLIYVGDRLEIRYSDTMMNLAGLENLIRTGGLFIDNNIALTNLDGLEGLTKIYGDLEIGWLSGNPSLISLEGLENLTSIDGFLRVKKNSVLESLSGLDNIDAESIEYIEIYGNPLLSQCEVLSICEYLAINDTAYIIDNDIGCNSMEEVMDSCGIVGIQSLRKADWCFISPNPFTISTTIEYTLQKPCNVHFTIYNVQGQIVFSLQERQDKGVQRVEWSTEGLPARMYYFRIQAGEMVGSGKMVVGD